MKLEFDVPPDAQRRTHALVIGVSSYPYLDGPEQTQLGATFEMSELSASAASAADVASWLISEYDNDAPLATLRILLSPVDGEAIDGAIAPLLQGPCNATRAAVEEAMTGFKADCQSDDAVAFVYVVGHGVQITKRGAVLLLEDVAAPNSGQELHGALDVTSCFEGLDGPQFAPTQFWFFDVCRERLQSAALETWEGAYKLSVPAGTAESSTMYLGSSTREAAFSVPNGRSIFSTALLEAFRGAGADGPTDLGSEDWWVTTRKLFDALRLAVKRLAREHGADQNVEPVGLRTDTKIHRLDGVPDVQIRLAVDPEDAGNSSRLSLLFNGTEPHVENSSVWPFVDTVPAGIYKVTVATQAPYQNFDKLRRFMPPGLDDSLPVGLCDG